LALFVSSSSSSFSSLAFGFLLTGLAGEGQFYLALFVSSTSSSFSALALGFLLTGLAGEGQFYLAFFPSYSVLMGVLLYYSSSLNLKNLSYYDIIASYFLSKAS
jgi:hypothetical protein